MTVGRRKIIKFNLRSLRLSLKYRPDVLKLILKMRQCIRNKNAILIQLKQQLKAMENKTSTKNNTEKDHLENSNKIDSEPNQDNLILAKEENTLETENVNEPKLNKSTQTEYVISSPKIESDPNKSIAKPKESGWKLNEDNESKSIADQVIEVAQNAIQQTGMVYVESAGMYYDYKTGYYYNSELGLYYHTDTDCYYSYSDKKQEFVFHSYPDRKQSAAQASLAAHEKRKAKKHKMARKAEEEIDNLTKNLSQAGEENNEKKPKRKKTKKKAEEKNEGDNVNAKEKKFTDSTEQCAEPNNETITVSKEEQKENNNVETDDKGEDKAKEVEEGECSATNSEESDSEDEEVKSNASTSTATDDESVASHHPPCMRVIVRETNIPKLRIGSLFIVTKDGGTVGRVGEHHAILINDSNVSRNHMNIIYDDKRRLYFAVDLGSKNGSVLNGSRMSESEVVSEPMEVVHGSTIQLGETKLLCHIHPGNNTCGHCEPGLLMEAMEKEKKAAYTRTCNVKKQHELELARLKNKYAKPQLAIEETAYNDRAQVRRDTVGSSHHAEKTQTSDISMPIAADNKGFKLLEKMGWNEGQGLGKDNQGYVAPVPLISNEGKTGLGAMPVLHNPNKLGSATIRLAARTKMLQPPAKAFQGTFDEDSE